MYDAAQDPNTSVKALVMLSRRLTAQPTNTTEDFLAFCDQYLFRVKGVTFYVVIVGIGVILNILSFYVLSVHKRDNVATFCLRAITLFDLLYLVIKACLQLDSLFIYAKHDNESISYFLECIHPFIRKYTLPLLTFAQSSSTWTCVLGAVHRYMAVCKPLKATPFSTIKRARRQLVLLASLTFIYALPRMFEWNIVCGVPHPETTTPVYFSSQKTMSFPESNLSSRWAMRSYQLTSLYSSTPISKYSVVNNVSVPRQNMSFTKTYCKCTYAQSLFGDKNYQIIYRNLITYIFSSIVPCIIMIVLTMQLLKTLFAARKKREAMARTHSFSNGQVTLMLVAVIICQTFFTMISAVARFIPTFKIPECPDPLWQYLHFIDFIMGFNCIVNFFIYFVLSGTFRKILIWRLCGCIPGVDISVAATSRNASFAVSTKFNERGSGFSRIITRDTCV